MNDFPSKDDNLFKPDTSNGAWITNPAGGWFLYIEGFRKSTDLIFEMIKESPSSKHILIYPLVFNSRQTIELMLKDLITKGYKYLNVEKEFNPNHFLKEQWNLYKTEILPHTTKTAPSIYEGAESIIYEFDNVDSHSMNFRYPFTKKDGKKASLNIESLDLENFKDIIDRLIVFLEGQWEMLDQLENVKYDI